MVFMSHAFFQILLTVNDNSRSTFLSFFFELGFTLCKAEQPLQSMELQEKEAEKD